MKECPYCGCNEFYTKERAKCDVRFRHSFSGEEVDNSEMHDGLTYSYASKYIYCDKCNRKIGKLEDVGLA